MENENAIIKLVDELVNAQDNVSELRAIKSELTINYRKIRSELDKLIEVILNNCKLDYKEEDLDLKIDIPVLQYVKFIDPDSYEDRLGELKFQNAAKREEHKLENKPVKEARKNGK